MKLTKNTKLFCIAFGIAVFLLLFGSYAVHERKNNERIYDEAMVLFEAGETDAAIEKLKEMPNFINYSGVQEVLINYHVDSVCPYCGHDLK